MQMITSHNNPTGRVRKIESMNKLARRGTALRRNPDVIAKRFDEATVLVYIPTGRIFELNETGAQVWELLGQGLDADHIMGQMVNEFEIDGARVNKVVARLKTEGLLVE
jgi:hypothetical protein